MGIGKIPLPAPTESTILQNSGDEVPTELGTDISRRTDRTSYSIPEDGRPITVDAPAGGSKAGKTHFLIEYFEGGKGANPSSKPSVRVKVTPSAGKSGKGARDHIQITESTAGQEPSYTKRIALPRRGTLERHTIGGDEHSEGSILDGASLDSKRSPVEIEVMHKDQESDLSDRRYNINPSEISEMPPDSLLEVDTRQKTSRNSGLTKAALGAGAAAIGAATLGDTLESSKRRDSREASRERITRKVIERLGKDHEQKHRTKSSSQSPNVSQEQLSETLSSPRRQSGKHRKLEERSEVSGVTDSQVSGTSARSDTSRYSVTNPRLLAAVEDSIRRLILPEIQEIKARQKRESLESNSKSDNSRRVSKHSEGSRSREGSIKKRRSRNSDKYEDSPSERSFEKGQSQETVIYDGKHKRRSKESGKLRDVALGAAAGGLLTHAALKHHDSGSSFDRKERRRKRSKSQSRSVSVVSGAETEEIFNKHDVPPMPMRSEITGSDMTRDSILSEMTSTGSFEQQQAEIREIARVSPKQVYATGRKQHVKSPSGLRHAQSYDDEPLQEHEEEVYSQRSESYDGSPVKQHFGEAALAGATAGAGMLAANEIYRSRDVTAPGPGRYVHGRSLSPIQSVASYEERGVSRHNSQRRTHSTGSLSSLGKPIEGGAREVGYDDFEEDLKKKHRPLGINLESRSEVLVGQDIKSPKQTAAIRHISGGSWFEGDDHEPNRDSGTSYESSRVPVGRLSRYTDDSMDAPYLDKVTAAQEVREGAEGNAEWVHTPVAVESAVASLLEPSVIESTGSDPAYSRGNRLDSPSSEGHRELGHGVGYVESPLKQTHGIDYDDDHVYSTARNLPPGRFGKSPRQSPPVSIKDRDSFVPVMTGNAMPDPNDPMPEIGHIPSRSDISTNPPDIQGPKKYDTPVHWPYTGDSATVPQPTALQTSNSTHDSLKEAAKRMLSVAAGAGKDAAIAQQQRLEQEPLDRKLSVEDYGVVKNQPYTREVQMTSPYFKDEGYETNVPGRSPGALTPDNRHKVAVVADPSFGLEGGEISDDDVFTMGNLKRMSGNSHGMAPLYDAVTGEGKERIESKDIIALMDHLTVRDAQRNARDTEILVTLVQSAAEMRNSFEEMKRFIASQDNMMIAVGSQQHAKTQRIIGGPRPQPSRSAKRVDSTDSVVDDIPPKRRNVIRRALKGLTSKNSSDLAKIEEMLNHLLDEVAELKTAQQVAVPASLSRGPGLTSYEQLRDMPQEEQDGYEPEGNAGTGSTNASGYLSPNPPAARDSRAGPERRSVSHNRISTVMEEDEDNEPLTPSEQQVLGYENTEHMLTPTGYRQRGSSVPLDTPPKFAQQELPKSVENTPRTDKSRKHKSSSSSFFPKISRWSKTTASTIPDRQHPNASYSGLDLADYDVSQHYDPAGDDRIRSAESLHKDRPPSPLIPSEVSRVSEKPYYEAHRNSLNLQHPQPRQGPTARYQNHLESQVRDASSPISPASDHFGSNPILARYNNTGGNRNSSAEYSSPAPPRPPKINDQGPLIPPKIPLSSTSPSQQVGSGRKQTFLSRSAAGQETIPPSTSPNPSLSPTPGKKPTGPRPITSSGSYTPDKVAQLQRNRYRGSPNAIDVDSEIELEQARRRGEITVGHDGHLDDDAESETF